VSAYLVALINSHDRSWVAPYTEKMKDYERKHNGVHITAGPLDQVEGEPTEAKTLVIVQFPDMAAARAFYTDPEYEPLIRLAGAGRRVRSCWWTARSPRHSCERLASLRSNADGGRMALDTSSTVGDRPGLEEGGEAAIRLRIPEIAWVVDRAVYAHGPGLV
jgi:uncharacterized protein (DUF1330 family)